MKAFFFHISGFFLHISKLFVFLYTQKNKQNTAKTMSLVMTMQWPALSDISTSYRTSNIDLFVL